MHWDVSKHAPLFCFIGPKNCWFCMVSNHHTCTYFFWPKPYISSTCLQLGVTNIDAPASSSSRPNVFVGVLVSGLLAALGIIVGYLKCQRRSDVKEVKLVSTFSLQNTDLYVATAQSADTVTFNLTLWPVGVQSFFHHVLAAITL